MILLLCHCASLQHYFIHEGNRMLNLVKKGEKKPNKKKTRVSYSFPSLYSTVLEFSLAINTSYNDCVLGFANTEEEFLYSFQAYPHFSGMEFIGNLSRFFRLLAVSRRQFPLERSGLVYSFCTNICGIPGRIFSEIVMA